MKSKNRMGFGLVSAIAATAIIGISAGGLIQYSNTVGQAARDANSRAQEDSFKIYQSEFALSGVDPSTASSNPVTAATHTVTTTTPVTVVVPGTEGYFGPNGWVPGTPETTKTIYVDSTRTVMDGMPTVAVVGGASSSQAGSAAVMAYQATATGRAASVGYRILTSGGTSAPIPTTPLAAPVFNFSGVIPEATFASNPTLTGFLTPASGNPVGTVVRYTVDGSTPISTSPIWDASAGFTAYTPPAQIKAAAFSSDPNYSTSSVVTTSLQRTLTVVYGRSSGSSTSFTYAEVTGHTNPIRLTVSNPPVGTSIYYTYDGSTPTTSSTPYTGTFDVPLANWSAGGANLQAIVVNTSSHITGSGVLSVTLSPTQVQLSSPTFSTTGGTATAVTLPISSSISDSSIRYGIDVAVTAASPTIPSGSAVTVTAP